MSKLVNSINKLKKSDVKDTVDKRMKEFAELGKRTNEDLFKELCFCILTANYTATGGIKIQKEVDSGFLELSEISLAKRLKTLGHRFPNTRTNYIITSRRCKNSLKKVIAELKSESLREWLVKNVKGFGMKEASLPYDEKIFIIIDGKANLIEIGKLFDLYNKGYLKNKKIEVPSFNPKTLKFEIAPVSNIMKHFYKKDLHRIHLEMGRKVSVTGDHSIFAFDGEIVVPVEARKLKVGDYVVIPKKLPIINSYETEMNIVQEFIKGNIFSDIYLKSKDYCKFIREKYGTKTKRKNQYVQYFRGIIPLKVISNLPAEAYSNDILKRFGVKLSFGSSPNTMNSIVKLNKDIFWVLGILIAEASLVKNPIEITLGLEEYDRFLKLNNLLEHSFGVNVKTYRPRHRNVYISKVHNLGFFYLINKILDMNGKSITKKIPEIVFSNSFANIIHFLQGYWEGDGWKKSKSYFSVSTNSDDLADGVLNLLSMLNITARHCKKKPTGKSSNLANTIDFSGFIQPIELESKESVNKKEVIPDVGDLLHSIHKQLNIMSKINGKHTNTFKKVMVWKHINNPSREKLKCFIKQLEKYGSCKDLEKLKKIVYSDLSFVKIKKIEKLNYNKKYVYDIEVAKDGKNFQNFVGGFGGVCLHNSHFLRNIGFTDYAIIDFHIVDILVKNKIIKNPKNLNKKTYLEIEDKMRILAKRVNLNLAEIDMYLWYLETGKILK